MGTFVTKLFQFGPYLTSVLCLNDTLFYMQVDITWVLISQVCVNYLLGSKNDIQSPQQ